MDYNTLRLVSYGLEYDFTVCDFRNKIEWFFKRIVFVSRRDSVFFLLDQGSEDTRDESE